MTLPTALFGESSSNKSDFELPFGDSTSANTTPSSTGVKSVTENKTKVLSTSNAKLAGELFGGADKKPETPIPDITSATAHMPKAKSFPMPEIPERFTPEFDKRWGHYILPDVANGSVMAKYPRVTTIGKTLDDTEHLEKWKTAKLIEGLQKYRGVLDIIDPQALADGERAAKDAVNILVERVRESVGGSDAGRFGDSVHAWTEFIDLGLGTIDDVPEEVKAHVQAYLNACQVAGIKAVPMYVERIAHNKFTGTAGRIDRISMMPDGTLVILDVKTTKNLSSALLGIGVQLAQYATADYMLSEDGTHWEPMPPVSQTLAIVAHVPSVPDPNEGVYCELVDIDLSRGVHDMHLSTDVRQARKTKNKLMIGKRLRALASDVVADQQEVVSITDVANTDTETDFLTLLNAATSCKEMTALYNQFVGKITTQQAEVAKIRFTIVNAIEEAENKDDIIKLYAEYSSNWTDTLTQIGQAKLSKLTGKSA